MRNPDIAIIGGGPAGLAIAGRLVKNGIKCIIYEKSSTVGHSWYNHYDRLHLHTVKEFSHLPYLPFPKEYPQYVSRKQFVDYLEKYAKHFDLDINTNHEVIKLERQEDRWSLGFKKSNINPTYEIVVVATGYNQYPIMPDYVGLSDFTGIVLHSKKYKNPRPFKGLKVLVVGMGNTGAEIGLDLVNHGIETTISIRGPVNIVPRDFYGRPTQKTAMLLRKFPSWLGDRIGILLRRIAIGDLSAYGIETPNDPPAAQLRKYGKTPVIDIGTVDLIKKGKITMAPAIQKFEEKEIVFKNGSRQLFDAVILATGYRAKLDDWILIDKEFFDAKGAAKMAFDEKYKGLYFLGFDTSYSGILNSIYEQSAEIYNHMLKEIIASRS